MLDVGAFAGQYVRELRTHGYRGRVVSFEPLAEARGQLCASAAEDPDWSVLDVALGDVDGISSLNVAGNSYSSSLLEMRSEHRQAAPGSAYVGRQEVRVVALDSVFASYRRPGDRVYLKVDAQGYEDRVLAGAASSLAAIQGVQLEMSLVTLYEGQMLYREMIQLMDAHGFSLMSLEPGFFDPASGRLLQMDGVFFRAPALGETRIGDEGETSGPPGGEPEGGGGKSQLDQEWLGGDKEGAQQEQGHQRGDVAAVAGEQPVGHRQ